MKDFTFAMIKPDVIQRKQCGKIITIIEAAGFAIQAMQLARLTPETASLLYKVHREQTYYASLCAFIASGPVVPMILAKANAVTDFDQLKDAIRAQFAASRTHNALHGASTAQAACIEAALFFT